MFFGCPVNIAKYLLTLLENIDAALPIINKSVLSIICAMILGSRFLQNFILAIFKYLIL